MIRTPPHRLAMLLACLAVASCSTPGASSTSTTPQTSAIAVMPSANDFTSAVTGTRSLGTADVDVKVKLTGFDGPRSLEAAGAAVLTRGRADLVWSSPTGSFRELTNDQAIFTQAQPPDGPWIRTDRPGTTPTSGYADVMRGLSVLRDVAEAGPQDLDGIATSRYTGWLPATAPELQALGLTTDDATRVIDVNPDSRVVVTVWLDSRDHVVQIARDLAPASPGDPEVHATTSLKDFSVLLNLNSPRNVTGTR